MKDLFVCDAGIVRSPAAVRVAKELTEERGIENYEAKSCSMEFMDSYPISPEAFWKYKRIFVMSQDLKDEMIRRYNILENKVINLDVKDVHSISEEKFRKLLEDELKGKLEGYF